LGWRIQLRNQINMQIRILGCSGGIGGQLRTTSLLVDHDVLIDAGTGVGDLSMEELLQINHIFVTHSHLDHIACIPLLLDTVMGFRTEPVTVHATKETLSALRTHIFNWKIWPDFNMIPDAANPFLRYNEIELDKVIDLKGRKFTAIPANHVIPAVGYQIDSGINSLVFTGDTTECPALWEKVNLISNLKYLIIETAFSNSEFELAKVSKHLCPSMLMSELKQLHLTGLKQPLEVFITHLKPGEGEMIMQEIADGNIALQVKALVQKQCFIL
jgi:ribonuclease BN (tRNA processing enzyme)